MEQEGIMTIIITKTLDDSWATLPDEQIVELVQEDLSELTDGATWEVKR